MHHIVCEALLATIFMNIQEKKLSPYPQFPQLTIATVGVHILCRRTLTVSDSMSWR